MLSHTLISTKPVLVKKDLGFASLYNRFTHGMKADGSHRLNHHELRLTDYFSSTEPLVHNGTQFDIKIAPRSKKSFTADCH